MGALYTEDSPIGHYKSDTSPYKSRLEMAQKAFGKTERMLLSEISPLETVKIIMKVKELSITYIIGADNMEWMKNCSDRGEAIFFKGNTEPKSFIRDPQTKIRYSYSGRSVYELRPKSLIVIERDKANIPNTFLNVPTEKFIINANQNLQIFQSSTINEEGISSTTVRKLVQDGKIEDARKIVARGLQSCFDKFTYLWKTRMVQNH